MTGEYMKNKNHGGKRAGAGRPKKPGTTNLVLRLPVSLKQELRTKYGKELNHYILELIKKAGN